MTSPRYCAAHGGPITPDYAGDVGAFHARFGVIEAAVPAFPSEDAIALRLRLITEELGELMHGLATRDMPETADALADLLYVVFGTARTLGIPIDAVWREVHDSNMRKTGGAIRPDGKILKPEGWQAPDVAGVLYGRAADPIPECPGCRLAGELGYARLSSGSVGFYAPRDPEAGE